MSANNIPRSLIEQVLLGNQVASEELHRELYPFVRSVVCRHVSPCDVEDVIQETMFKIFRNLQSFAGHAEFRSWVFKIARNEAFTWLRKSQARTTAHELSLEDFDVSQEARIDQRLDAQRILSRLFNGNHQDLSLFLDLKMEGYDVKTVAKKYGLTESCVKIRVHRLRKFLLKKLKTAGRLNGTNGTNGNRGGMP